MPLLSLSLSIRRPKKDYKMPLKSSQLLFHFTVSQQNLFTSHSLHTFSLSNDTPSVSVQSHRKTNYPEVLFRLLTLFSFILLSPFLKAFSNNNGLIFPSPFCSVITLIYFFADSSERKKKKKRTNKETIFIQSYQQ